MHQPLQHLAKHALTHKVRKNLSNNKKTPLIKTLINLKKFTDEHIKHYESMSITQINRLLQTALDVECLFSLICKEEDADSKHIYFFLFKVKQKNKHLKILFKFSHIKVAKKKYFKSKYTICRRLFRKTTI